MSSIPPSNTWTAGSSLEASLKIAGANFVPLFVGALILATPELVVSVADLGWMADLVAGIICNSLIDICLTCGALQVIAGRKPTLGSILGQLKHLALGKLMALTVVQSIALLASAALVIPALFLAALWAVTVPAMLVERASVSDAFARSTQLTRGRRWRVLGALLLAILVLLVVLGVLFFVVLGNIGVVNEGTIGGHLGQWLARGVSATVIYSQTAMLYFLLRNEKDGLTKQQLQELLP